MLALHWHWPPSYIIKLNFHNAFNICNSTFGKFSCNFFPINCSYTQVRKYFMIEASLIFTNLDTIEVITFDPSLTTLAWDTDIRVIFTLSYWSEVQWNASLTELTGSKVLTVLTHTPTPKVMVIRKKVKAGIVDTAAGVVVTFTWLTAVWVDQVTIKVGLIVVQGLAFFTLQKKRQVISWSR